MDYAKYMAYLIIYLMYKYWPAYTKWMELPLETAKQAFAQGKRHDALGDWDTWLKWILKREYHAWSMMMRCLNLEEVADKRKIQRETTSSDAFGRIRSFLNLFVELCRLAIIDNTSRSRTGLEFRV